MTEMGTLEKEIEMYQNGTEARYKIKDAIYYVV